jgi:hypothetical protein
MFVSRIVKWFTGDTSSLETEMYENISKKLSAPCNQNHNYGSILKRRTTNNCIDKIEINIVIE